MLLMCLFVLFFGGKLKMLDGPLIIKIIGASLGSSIAVIFKPGKDTYFRLFQRFIMGMIIGVISAPIITEFFGWKHAVDYWLASAALGGVLGYLILQVLLSEATADAIKNHIPGAKK